jgi:hypothetical protein
MRRLISIALVGAHLSFFFHLILAQDRNGKPPQPALQPVAFSHKRHSEAGLRCPACHTKAETEEQAGIPVASDCTQCHRKFKPDGALMQTLGEYEKSGKEIPWVRVYDLPDFVFFSHQAHLRAKADCQTCHGPVETRDALWREREISMKACVACHKETGASAACNYCHELNK